MKHQFLLGAVSALLGFSGCSSPENSSHFFDNGIKLAVTGINDLRTRAGYESTTDITEDDPGFGIYIVDDPLELQSSGNRADNHQIKWYNSEWLNYTAKHDNIKLVWPANASVKVNAYAYCPYQKITDITNIKVRVHSDQRFAENVKSSDFLTAISLKNGNTDNNTLPVTFSHRLTKLKFNISWNNQNETGLFQSLYLQPTSSIGYFNFHTNKITSDPDFTGGIYGYISSQTATFATVEIIVIPQTIPSGNFVTIRTLKEGKDVFYTLNLEDALNLSSSNQYIFNITLNNTQAVLSPVTKTISGWTDIDEGNHDLTSPIKKENPVRVSLLTDSKGLVLSSSLVAPLEESKGYKKYIDILLDGNYYSFNKIFYPNKTTGSYPHDSKLGGKNYTLSLRTRDLQNEDVEGTAIDDGTTTYTIEPQSIYIPVSTYIEPTYNPSDQTITLTSDQPAQTDLTYRIFQYNTDYNDELIGTDLTISQGTTTSQTIDVSTWDKDKNIVISFVYKGTDINFNYCRTIRNNVYYHLKWGYWGGHETADGTTCYTARIALQK